MKKEVVMLQKRRNIFLGKSMASNCRANLKNLLHKGTSQERKNVGRIMRNNKVASRHVLSLGQPITVFRKNRIVRIHPDGSENIVAPKREKDAFVTIKQKMYSLE